LINAVNALRASYGLAPYSVSPILMATAQSHADYMAATGHVSHTGLGGSSVTDRLLSAGYPLAGDLSLGGFRSENITSGSEGKTAQDAVTQWTGDAPHLTTMISPNLTEIGAGVTVNGGRVYYVIDCALPTTNGVPQQAPGTPIAGGSTVAPAGGVIIPVQVVTPNADGDVIHEVKAGQTLWQLAISYETKIDEIKRLNNLYDNEIYPGTNLLIKKGVIASPTVVVESVPPGTIEAPTSLPPLTATVGIPIATSTLIRASAPVPRERIMSVAMGILVLSLLGGVFMSLGNTRKND
jgi:LysM repeat protein